jgi:hypothetical protein
MPISYEVDETRNFVHVKLTGKITEEELMAHANNFFADPRIKPGFKELFDATAGVASGMTSRVVEGILSLESQHEELYAGAKLALVVPDKEGWELAKEYERQAQGSVIVFYNLDIAKKWLVHDD